MSDSVLTVVDLLLQSVQRHGDLVVYEDDADRLTLAEVRTLALGGAADLRQADIGHGDRVAIVMDDGADYLCALLAVWLRGAVPVPVNRSQNAETVQFVLGQSDPKATLLDEAVEFDTPTAVLRWRRNPSAGVEPVEIRGDDDAMILYTSGTTGVPKGVRHSHHALALNAVEMSEMLGLGSADRIFLNIPFYYSNSISHLLMAVFNGACICAVHGFLFGDALLAEAKRVRATGFAGVPAHYVRMIDNLEMPVSSELRFLMNSGDHLPVNVLRALRRFFPGVDIFCVYGISECAPRVCCLDPALLDDKMGSVGRPLPATVVSVRDESAAVLPAGELGEIYVRSACLMKEYFRNPQANARSMTEHGFRTGDMGYLDDDGCLFLSGRTDSVFKSGGEKVSCRLIEETLRDHAQFARAMSDVVVAERTDHFLGKVACVYYVERPGGEQWLKTIRRDLRRQLPKSHIPKQYQPVRTIERSPSGKVVKNALFDPGNLADSAGAS